MTGNEASNNVTPLSVARRAITRATSGRFTISEVRSAGESGLPVHTHHYEDSFFFVLEGDFQFHLGLQTIDAGEGRIEAFGQAVQENGRISRRVRETRTRVGFIFQQFNLVGRLSLFTNVALGSLGRINPWRGLAGLWPPETREAAMAALARVGVAEYAGQRANTLSGGQQQRGAIARALVQRAIYVG